MNTVATIIGQEQTPAIEMDDEGFVTSINNTFEKKLGWTRQDLIGKPLTTIIPPAMRDVHAIGFSRFLSTEKPTLLNKPLQLTVQLKDGRVVKAEHIITAEKLDGRWRFAATIKPEA